MASQPRLYLIDGHALAYRTYFALTGIGDGARWMTQGGEPTAGTYGFTSVLLKLLARNRCPSARVRLHYRIPTPRSSWDFFFAEAGRRHPGVYAPPGAPPQ